MSVEISLRTPKNLDSPQNVRVYDDFPTSHLRLECRRAEGLVAAAFNLAMVRAFMYQGEK